MWESTLVSRGKHPGGRRWLAAVSHPTRRDGAVALALLLLPWAVALVQVLRHHRLDSGAVGIVATVSLGLPALWLAWVGYRDTRRSTQNSGLTMVRVADQLALAVGAQWEAEAATRRLNDPYPLSVSWDPADESLTDSWDSLVKLATSGAGWPAPPPAGTWASGPDGLAGTGGDLVEVLARVPAGRLVVLGEPGAGKTVLMVRLVLDLLARRTAGGLVPILASVASWNPARQGLQDWLAAQLMLDHPGLAAAPPTDTEEPTWAAALLASGLILPVLDGLDEIPGGVRGPAITRINDALRPGQRLVVTCRSLQYRDAVRPPDGVEVTLRGAAAVQLHPLDADTVRRYLCDDAGGPVARARWAPVLAALGTMAPAGQALTTPLMVGLARVIYNPRPGELPGALRDPAEICKPELADRAAVEASLFDAFIPAAYRPRPAERWTSRQAERWLVFLAREDHAADADIAWWHLVANRSTIQFWLTAVLAAGLAGLAAGLGAGFVAGIRAGIAAGIGIWLVAGFMAVVTALSAAALGPMRGVSAATGLGGGPRQLPAAASPKAVLAGDRQEALITMLAPGLAIGLAAGLAASLAVGPAAGFEAGLTGLAAGLAFGIWLGNIGTAWLSYVLIRSWLALHHRLPWRLMSFLADAHRRGVLRQAGAVYQFRHIELQHRLATRPSKPPA
jgi:NACHT domain